MTAQCDPDRYDCDDDDSWYGEAPYRWRCVEEAQDKVSEQYKARIQAISIALEAGRTDDALRLSRILETYNWEALEYEDELDEREANPPPPKRQPRTPQERRMWEATRDAWRGTVTAMAFQEHLSVPS